VRHGADIASVRARISEDDASREQTVGLKVGARLARIDGKRPASLASYALRTPVVVFHPGEVALSMGGGSERRKLLDRLSLYLRVGALDDLDRYQRAMRERQRALETRGPSASDLEQWEELMVRHGSFVMGARADVAERLAVATIKAFSDIAAPGLSLAVAYAPGAPRDDDAFRRGLALGRASDQRRGGASLGPHRDDIALRLDDRPMRGIASQGQHRAAVLALKAAEISVVGSARGARPILLLDDVSSELDRARTEALFLFLQEQRGQVFLTTTRPELIAIPEAERTDFYVRSGRVAVGGNGSSS
jgi:DNA replication and repair protein RecF